MSLITFTCTSPAASWSPSVNPRYGGGYTRGTEKFQPKDFAGADLYSYNHGTLNTRRLEWSTLPAADMTTLLAFLAVVKGVYAFTFTDYEATAYPACRVLNFQNFEYRNRTLTVYEVSLEIEVA